MVRTCDRYTRKNHGTSTLRVLTGRVSRLFPYTKIGAEKERKKERSCEKRGEKYPFRRTSLWKCSWSSSFTRKE